MFLAASSLASGWSAAKTLFRARHTASYAGYLRPSERHRLHTKQILNSPNKRANGNYSSWWGVPLDSRFSRFYKWINDNVLFCILLRKRSDLEKHWTITLAFLNSILRFSWIKNFWRKLMKLNQIHKLRPRAFICLQTWEGSFTWSKGNKSALLPGAEVGTRFIFPRPFCPFPCSLFTNDVKYLHPCHMTRDRVTPIHAKWRTI